MRFKAKAQRRRYQLGKAPDHLRGAAETLAARGAIARANEGERVAVDTARRAEFGFILRLAQRKVSMIMSLIRGMKCSSTFRWYCG